MGKLVDREEKADILYTTVPLQDGSIILHSSIGRAIPPLAD